jgi:hypothetical protein
MVAVEGAEMKLLCVLDEVGADEKALDEVCGDEMLDDGEVGEVPGGGKKLAGGSVVGFGESVVFFGGLGGSATVGFDCGLEAEVVGLF